MIPIRYNMRSLAVRKTTTLATAFGIGLVVFVLAAALMLSAGVKKTLSTSGRPDVAMVMRIGSDAELGSVVDSERVNAVLGAPGVKKDEKGLPIGSPEIVVVGAMKKVGVVGLANVQIRGISEAGKALRPGLKIVAGRFPNPAADEVMVGTRIRGRFEGSDSDQSFEIHKNQPVKVVGVFEDGGSSYESEIWADVERVRAAYHRQGVYSSVRVKLESPAAFDRFKAAMEGDKRFGFTAMRDAEYFEKQSEGLSMFINVLGVLISVFFAIGAMIGAMITMYAAIANRQREIGTLRALGFSRTSILTSFLLESVALALGGGVLGALAAMGMSFVKFSMLNRASWSEVVFTFDPTPQVILVALAFAGIMGLFGGLLPAVRAARISPIIAMRGG